MYNDGSTTNQGSETRVSFDPFMPVLGMGRCWLNSYNRFSFIYVQQKHIQIIFFWFVHSGIRRHRIQSMANMVPDARDRDIPATGVDLHTYLHQRHHLPSLQALSVIHFRLY